MAPECGKIKKAEKAKALANVALMVQNVTDVTETSQRRSNEAGLTRRISNGRRGMRVGTGMEFASALSKRMTVA